MKELEITLKRSFIGRCKKHKKILRALGLRRLNQSVVHNDVPSVRGMLQKVSYMVEVEKHRGNK
jgi:large subunit ribosomal protein L30